MTIGYYQERTTSGLFEYTANKIPCAKATRSKTTCTCAAFDSRHKVSRSSKYPSHVSQASVKPAFEDVKCAVRTRAYGHRNAHPDRSFGFLRTCVGIQVYDLVEVRSFHIKAQPEQISGEMRLAARSFRCRHLPAQYQTQSFFFSDRQEVS